MPGTIERDVLIEAPADVVWDVLTDPAQIPRWFSDSAEIDLRPGGAGTLGWREHGSVEIAVERVERPRLFSFRWMSGEGENRWANSLLVEFTLTDEAGGTRLRVVESGLDELDWSEERRREYREDHSSGWATHMGRLRDLFAQEAAAAR